MGKHTNKQSMFRHYTFIKNGLLSLIAVSFLLLSGSVAAQTKVTIASWNLENFGKSKSDSVINFIANTIRNFDVVAIQEVVAGDGGAQAVARLSDALNRKGNKWDYRISDPTSGENSYKRTLCFFMEDLPDPHIGHALA
jgi:ketosteroid isomerase-like protein